jgi:hypothetical protein
MKKKTTSHFPLLREFARGYLHQDVMAEYGDAKSAARAYLANLPESDHPSLREETARMHAALKQWTADELNRQLAALGAAWTFDSPEEFASVLELFEHGK